MFQVDNKDIRVWVLLLSFLIAWTFSTLMYSFPALEIDVKMHSFRNHDLI